jgi:hypothetical protein
MDALFRDANAGSCNILALASIKDARVPALGNSGTLNRGGSPYSPLR